MTQVISVPTADETLLAEVLSQSGRRLTSAQIVSSGPRFLLARAKHVPSGKQVLLMISKLGFAHGRAQLANITEALAAARNPDLSEVVDRFWIREDPERWSCLVLTWYENAMTLGEYLITGDKGLGRPNVLECFRMLVSQVHSLHQAGFVHGDLSSSNVLIDSSGAHLSDLEYVTSGKFLFDEAGFQTREFAHPKRLGKLASKRYTLEDAQEWDRYALGRIAMSIISDANPYEHSVLTLYQQRALRLVGGLLMGSAIRPEEAAMGLDVSFFASEAYTGLAGAVAALDRLLGFASPETDIDELRAVPPSVVEMGLHRPVPFTTRVRQLVDTLEMQQIATCLQLGLINFIWPTATHTRIQHALGTFGMTCAAVINLYADPQSPFYRVLADSRTSRTVLAAALLHDVGHYPLAHDLEEAYEDVFDHERRSISSILNGDISRILTDSTDGWDVNPADVASIIDGAPLAGSSLSTWMCGLLHSLISGALDVDKLDYLRRDSHELGIAAGGGIDANRVISSLSVAVVPSPLPRQPDQLRVAVRAKGIRPAELVGRIRSHMFGVTYWHHSYRAIKAMIHMLVWRAVTADVQQEADIRKRAEAIGRELFESLDPRTAESQLPGFEAVLGTTAKISQREAGVLSFLAGKGQGLSDVFYQLLVDRNWYRTILTVEHFANTAATTAADGRSEALWMGMGSLDGVTPEKLVRFRLALNASVQEKLVAWFRSREEGAIRTQIVDWPAFRTRFVDAADVETLILVDLVEVRKSKDKPLYFIPVERPGSRLADTTRPLPVRRSYDQQQLQKEFVETNGAIRIFCHPDHQKFVSDSIPEDELLEILLAATNELLVEHRLSRRSARIR